MCSASTRPGRRDYPGRRDGALPGPPLPAGNSCGRWCLRMMISTSPGNRRASPDLDNAGPHGFRPFRDIPSNSTLRPARRAPLPIGPAAARRPMRSVLAVRAEARSLPEFGSIAGCGCLPGTTNMPWRRTRLPHHGRWARRQHLDNFSIGFHRRRCGPRDHTRVAVHALEAESGDRNTSLDARLRGDRRSESRSRRGARSAAPRRIAATRRATSAARNSISSPRAAAAPARLRICPPSPLTLSCAPSC